jgi:phospholipid transport system substrate-binding protein
MKTRQAGRVVSILLVVAFVFGAWSPAAAGVATDRLRPAVDEILRVVNDPAMKAPAKRHVRRAAIRRVLEDMIDFREAARRALGPHWRERTAAERAEFVGLFSELVLLSYTASIDDLSREKTVMLDLFCGERVDYLSELVEDGAATVRTRLVRRDRPDVPVDYRMHAVGPRWLVYDVIVEGASLVANYRAQFHAVIKTASYSELVARIRARVVELTIPAPLAAR